MTRSSKKRITHTHTNILPPPPIPQSTNTNTNTKHPPNPTTAASIAAATVSVLRIPSLRVATLSSLALLGYDAAWALCARVVLGPEFWGGVHIEVKGGDNGMGMVVAWALFVFVLLSRPSRLVDTDDPLLMPNSLSLSMQRT